MKNAHILYPYDKENPIESPFTYTYTPFLGPVYIDAWRKYRRLKVPESLEINSPNIAHKEKYLPQSKEIESIKLLDCLIFAFKTKNIDVKHWY